MVRKPRPRRIIVALVSSACFGRHQSASVASSEKRVWLFGYGSLISEDSRRKTSTAVTGDSFPAIVRGLSRGWFTPVSLPEKAQVNKHIVAVQAIGVTEAVDAECSGIVFAVDASALSEFDEREVNYERAPIQWTRVQPIGDSSMTQKEKAESLDEECYCYVQKTASTPSPSHPVIQTYVDVILDGCAQTSRKFVHDFIRTTSQWPHTADGSYLDDRAAPGYVRYSADASAKGDVWDGLLEKEIPGIIAIRQRGPGIADAKSQAMWWIFGIVSAVAFFGILAWWKKTQSSHKRGQESTVCQGNTLSVELQSRLVA